MAAGDTHESLGRVVNALMGAIECLESGDPVQVVFDGAGTQAAAALAEPDHKYNKLLEEVRTTISVCSYCAGAYEVTEKIKDAELLLVDEFKGHPSFRKLIESGFQLLIF